MPDSGRERPDVATDPQVNHALFVYGTLLPGEERWRWLEPFVASPGDHTTVAGDLYDTGFGYPAAIFPSDPRYRGGTISGRVFELRSDSYDRALSTLDRVEGAVEGMYQRVAVLVGLRPAWAYQVGRDLNLTLIPSGDWRAWRTTDIEGPTTRLG